MITITSKATILVLLVISMTTIYAQAESTTHMPSPRQQMMDGTAPMDVICNSGFTLIAKLSSGTSACVKPSTAMKLEETGWGQILKDSDAMQVKRENMMAQTMMENEPIYDPKIVPSDFTTEITNPYLTLPIGTSFVYEEETDEGLERIEVFITDDTKTVMGVETLVYWDRVWINDVLIEDTKDWLAQDKEGNVWYFGEYVINYYENGDFKDNSGSWEAGVDGAKPGYWMKANPQVGESYKEEYYKGEAEDMAEIISLDETVTVTYGTFSECLKTKNWTPLEPDVIELKYYCPQIGNVVLEEVPAENEKVELIDVLYDQPASIEQESTPEPKPEPEPIPEPTTDITLEEAKQIALAAVPGVVTDTDTEIFQGKLAYVIEIQATSGPETDVFVDKKTGQVLGTET